jgi:hypothetical protein
MTEYLGTLYMALRPCGKVSAMAWDDGFRGPGERRRTLAEWAIRGDTVQRVERHKGDPMPEMICSAWDKCECRAEANNG